MTLVLTAQMRMDAAQAKAELASASTAVQKLGTETERSTQKSKASASAATAEAAARRLAAQEAQGLTTANRQAAGATGNLVAQFNDIGMMMAAGQNPLQMAIQQGSQITQVIGPMGAAGAARALGGAFVGMLNPLSLVTMGVIAFGATAVQWLLSAEDGARSVVEQLEEIIAATATTQTEIDKLQFGVDQDYQAKLLREQLALQGEYNAKVAELNGYLSTTTHSIDLQRVQTQTLRDEIGAIVERYNTISAALSDHQTKATQLAIIEGIKAQQAGETAARLEEGARAAEALTAKTLALVAALASADGSNLVGAFQSAFPVASQLLGMAESIVSTIGSAGAQVAAYESAQTSGLAAQYSQYGSGRVIGERLARESGDLYGGKSVLPASKGAGAGGGGGAARDEAAALQELITGLEAEIEALRVQDPIQQEMLKHREALAGATDAERQKVEELIAAREREAALMEGAKARAEFFGDIGNQALDSLINKGESFNDVLKNIISSLLKAIAQAALFGTGPFGSMFGGGSIMSLIIPGAKAEGGMVHGPGSGTSDSIPTMLSNGEYVVNARATARNRHLLEAINTGGRVGFAEGGYVGSDNRRSGAWGGNANLPSTIYFDLRGSNGDQAIEEKVRKGAAQMIGLYDREGLAVSMQRVSGDPKRRG